MDKYFSAEITDHPFIMFSREHLAALAIIAIINIALILWLNKEKHSRAAASFSYWLASLMLLNELFYILWNVWSGVWSLDYSLPLNLCDAATFLSAIMLIRSNYFSFEIVYFWGLGGALQALVTPDLAYSFPHFMFINFFISHGTILAAIIYAVAVLGFKPTLKSILKMFVFTNLYMAAMAVVNILTGGNYMFICRKPEGGSIIDFLGPWPWYILSLEGVALVISFISYIPFGIAERFKRSKRANYYSNSQNFHM